MTLIDLLSMPVSRRLGVARSMPGGRRSGLWVFSALWALSVGVGAPAALAQVASLTSLGPVPSPFNQGAASGVSDDGTVVVGTLTAASGITSGFRWTASGGLVVLGPLPGSGLTSSAAQGCSPDGAIVVGYAAGNAQNRQRGWKWTTTTGLVDLGLPAGELDAQATAISADGQVIVGFVPNAALGSTAVRWTGAGPALLAGSAAITAGEARGLSADGGVIVGLGSSQSGPQAFRWGATTGPVGLGDLPGGSFQSQAAFVTRDGLTTVGSGRGALGVEAVRWSAWGGPLPLGDLPGGTYSSTATACSADGSVVVGTSQSTAGAEAFIWTSATGMQRLSDVLAAQGVATGAWSKLASAAAISPDGRTIVGGGMLTGQFVPTPYIATLAGQPCPQPFRPAGKLQPTLPSARTGAQLAYDSTRGVTVMFGGVSGLTGSVYNGETWEWGGSAWVLKTTSGPAARAYGAMCFDSVRNKVVLFGGVGAGGALLGDTWEYDNGVWTQRGVPSPTARAKCAIAYDPIRQRSVLYGGLTAGNVPTSETWEWTGTAWQFRTVVGPSAREQAGMCFDRSVNRPTLFGGIATGVPQQDTWRWDGSAWQLVLSAGPTARGASGALVFDSNRGRAVLFGGVGASGPLADCWELTGTAWVQRSVAVPLARVGHACVFDAMRGATLVYGGDSSASGQLADLWRFDGQRFAPLAGPVPSARYGALAVADPTGFGLSMLLGVVGQSSPTTLLEHWTAQQAPTGPDVVWGRLNLAGLPLLQQASIATDSVRQRLILHGGSLGGIAQSQTFVLASNAPAWVPLTIGPARAGAAMAYDASRDRVVLFGGQDELGQLRSETFEFDGVAWLASVGPQHPGARRGASMAYDPVRQRIVLFGGQNEFGAKLDDTWERSAAGWGFSPAFGPAGRSDAALTFDGPSGKLLLVGGNLVQSALGDSWLYDGQQWIPAGSSAAVTRASAAAATLPFSGEPGGRALLFGGLNGSELGDAMVYFGDPTPTVTLPLPTTIDTPVRSPLVLQVGVSSVPGVPASYQWLRGGSPVLPGPGIDGILTTTLTIASPLPRDSGLYALRITTGCNSQETAPTFVQVGVPACNEADVASGDGPGIPDGVVDGSDFVAFINSFAIGDTGIDPTADINTDGTIDGTDFVLFVNAFAVGC